MRASNTPGLVATLPLALLAGSMLASPGSPQCQTAELTGSGPKLGLLYSPQSLAASGDTIAAGYTITDFAFPTGVYVFVRNGSGWTEEAVLTKPWPAMLSETMALEGDTLVCASGFANEVYVFTRSGGIWSEAATLSIPTGPSSYLWESVAISGDTIAVGMSSRSENEPGTIFIFVGGGSSWTLQATLEASDAPPFAVFGWSLDLGQDRLLVLRNDMGNGPGAVYEFRRSGTSWSQVDQIVPPPGQVFGGSLALDGASFAVGCGHALRAAYVFTDSGSGWVHEATIAADPEDTSVYYAETLALRGDRLVVGDAYAEHAGNHSGAAYLFERAGGTWTELDRLYGSDTDAGDYIGATLAFTGAGDIAAASCGCAHSEGKVYVFAEDPGCPSAAFAATPASGVAPLSVAFHDLSSGATSGPTWNFGDASPEVSDVHDVVHEYQDGEFNVSLTVGNATGIDRRIALDFIDVLICAKAVVRNGTGVNPLCFASTSLPVLGTTWTSEIDGQAHPGAVLTMLAVCEHQTAGPSAFGQLLVSPPLYALDSAPLVAGFGHHAIPVPANPALVGIWVYTQGAVLGGFVALCNGVDLQFGY